MSEWCCENCYGWSTLLFGCESGTTGQRMASQSEKLQKCGSYGVGLCCVLYGLIKCQNKEVLQRANTSRNLLKLIVNKQIRFVGHIMRKSQLEAIALTGMIEGKTARGRQRKTFMDWISFTCGEQWKVNDIVTENLPRT